MTSNSSNEKLSLIQKWMQHVVTYPEGISEGILSSEAQQQIPLELEQIEKVITRSTQLSSIERLQVYGNAYYARLIDCLGEEFPALKFALGEQAFSGFAFGYLQSYPSTSYTLDELGRNFPQYLRETRPTDTTESWPDFLIDLATLEWTYGDVFDGPGTEKEPPFDAKELASIPPQLWDQLLLTPAPCLRLMEFQFPVHEYATGVRKEESPQIPVASKTHLVIFRWDYVVRRRPVDETQYQLLQQLCADQTLGNALQAMFANSDQTDEEISIQLRDWFTFWSKWRFFSGYELNQ